MPVLEIDTNVSQEKITPEVVQEATKLLSEMLGLDVSVSKRPVDSAMLFILFFSVLFTMHVISFSDVGCVLA